MRIEAALWVWIQSYGAEVIRGEQSGGQRDIRLGTGVAGQLSRFLQGTRALRRGLDYTFSVQPYWDLPAWRLTLSTNAKTSARAGEVRLIRQDRRSREAYPLWAAVVKQVPTSRRATQAIVLLKDENHRLHARCVASNLAHLPKGLKQQMKKSLSAAGAPSGTWFVSQSEPVGRALAVGPPSLSNRRHLGGAQAGLSPAEAARRGLLAEQFVVRELKKRFASPRYRVDHVAANEPTSDHDVEVVDLENNTTALYAEVKGTATQPGSPVQISKRELDFGGLHPGRYSVFVIYLAPGGKLPPREVLELSNPRDYVLSPRAYWLWPQGV